MTVLEFTIRPMAATALQLYRASGFVPVDDLHILSLDLPPSKA